MRRLLHSLVWCLCRLRDAVLGLGWCTLLVVLVLQVSLVATRQMTLPEMARQELTAQVEKATGLRLEFSRARADLTGCLLLEDVSLGAARLGGPVATARMVYVRVARLPLLLGQVDWREVRVSGLDLLVPAPLSSTGRGEQVLSGLDFTLLPGTEALELTHFTGRLGKVSLSLAGSVRPPPPAPMQRPEVYLESYLQAARRLQVLARQLEPLESPHLELSLTAAERTLAEVTVQAWALGYTPVAPPSSPSIPATPATSPPPAPSLAGRPPAPGVGAVTGGATGGAAAALGMPELLTAAGAANPGMASGLTSVASVAGGAAAVTTLPPTAAAAITPPPAASANTLAAWPWPALGPLTVRTSFPLLPGPYPFPLAVQVELAQLRLPGVGAVGPLALEALATVRLRDPIFTLEKVALRLDAIELPDVRVLSKSLAGGRLAVGTTPPATSGAASSATQHALPDQPPPPPQPLLPLALGPVAITGQPGPGNTWSVQVLAGAFAQPWTLVLEGDPATRVGTLSVQSALSPLLLSWGGQALARDLSSLLVPTEPIAWAARLELGPGLVPVQVSGRFRSGPALARRVAIDEAAADFVWRPSGSLELPQVLLRQGDATARGSYSMDTRTLDYRFLLAGELRPQGIAGWFQSWWRNFFNNFAFPGPAPLGDVDIRGRWGQPQDTRLFLGVDASGAVLRGLAYDEVRTRLFIRPHWYDAQEFALLRGTRTARGFFTRSVDPVRQTWLAMTFDLTSTLPLADAALLGPAALAVVAPYEFTEPPQLSLSGQVAGPAAPPGVPRRAIDLRLSSQGALLYHGMPLSDLGLAARIDDQGIVVSDLNFNFGGGQARGQARLFGPETARRLAFDLRLREAGLVASLSAYQQWQLARGKPAPAPLKNAARLAHSRYDLELAAEGAYPDTFSFFGQGHAQLRDPDLGQLNLLGVLNEILPAPFRIGQLTFHTVDGRFQVVGDQLDFSSLQVLGPTAGLTATGKYFLRESTLAFDAQLHPFKQSDNLVGHAFDLVFTPISSILEVKLKGTLAQPNWIFSYGPSRLLRGLVGEGP